MPCPSYVLFSLLSAYTSPLFRRGLCCVILEYLFSDEVESVQELRTQTLTDG